MEQDHRNTTVPTIETSNGLAIAAMVCGIIGLILILTLIGVVIGLPLVILGLIFGIIVLAKKKPGKGMAITGVVVSLVGIIMLIIGGLFLGKVATELVPSITDFAAEMEQIVEDDPELAALMEDPEFAKQVEGLTEKRLQEMFEGKYEEGEFELDDLSEILDTGLGAYKDSLFELKEEYIAEQAATE